MAQDFCVDGSAAHKKGYCLAMIQCFFDDSVEVVKRMSREVLCRRGVNGSVETIVF